MRRRLAPAVLVPVLIVLGCGDRSGGGAASASRATVAEPRADVAADRSAAAAGHDVAAARANVPDAARAAGDASGAASGARAESIFRDATAATGLDFVHRNGMRGDRWFVEMMGAGVALFDYDDDGDLDLFLVQSGSLDQKERAGEPGDRLYRNDLIAAAGDGAAAAADGGGPRFVDVTAASGIVESGYGMGVATGDYDGDGRIDLYVTNWGSNELWRNLGGGRFERRGHAAGVDDEHWSVPAVFFDADRDGRLDLFVGNYVAFSAETSKRCLSALGVLDYCGPLTFEAQPDVLYRNRGDGTFADVSGPSGLRSAPPRPALGALAGDFDGDGWLDLYVANDQTENYLWRGAGAGRLVEEGLAAGCAVDAEGKPQASMGVTAGDLDGDGDEDLFLTHLTDEHHTLYQNDGGSFEDVTTRAGLVQPTWALTGFGVGALDYDGDGLLDLLAVSGGVKIIPEQVTAGEALPLRQPGVLLHNLGGARFVAVPLGPDDPIAVATVGRGAAFGDLDNDGDTDVVVTADNGPARVLLNQVGNRRPWIGVRAVERVDGRRRDVLDATVIVRRGGGQPPLVRHVRTAGSYASAGDPRALFGLGDSVAEGGTVESVVVRWPDGKSESWGALEIGRYHTLERGTGTPAPRQNEARAGGVKRNEAE